MWIKRLIDVVIAVVVLVLTALLWIVAALAIKFTSPGPVFYYHRRTGFRRREFNMIKFRSMRAGVDSASLATGQDPRVTRVGQWLRAASLDELPQLINVLRGEMSVVGPRPALPDMVPYYNDEEQIRLGAKPGLTGWAQVNGRNSLPYHERLRLDAWYVQNWSVWLDLIILIRTIPVVVRGRGRFQEDPRPWEHRPRAGGH